MVFINNIEIFKNDNLGIKVRTIVNQDNSISINAEDTAIGFGWVTVAKSGNEVVRWTRVNNYLNEIGFSKQVAKDDYIPESIFYLLAMKANNERALSFQRWLAMEVLPTIRKTGSYTIKPQVSFKEQVECVGIVADILRVNDASKLYMLNTLYKEYSLRATFLPQYVSNGNRDMKSATELLNRFNIQMSTKSFNTLLRANGYLEERVRRSSKNEEKVKKYNALTSKGLKYGENLISPHCQREVQPMYYVDTFQELYKLVC